MGSEVVLRGAGVGGLSTSQIVDGQLHPANLGHVLE